MSYCHGQGYDGAGNMAGRLCGVAALILKDFPKAPYFHCFSHQLNLCVAKACAIPSIRDMMDHVRIVSDFFNNSAKRLEDLSTKISELHHLFKRQSMFVEPVRKLLGYTRPLTKTLQKVDQDFSKARKYVENLKNTLISLWSSFDISHTEWYKEAVSIAATTNTMPSKPRICGQQIQRHNHESGGKKLKKRKKVEEFVCTYQNNLPEPRYFYAELDMWEVYWKNHSDSAPKTILDSLQKCDDHTFPNISTILRILCTLPVTTCTCET
ncbi:52 kDa repressor of the inhibitor of the protein kinase-like [Hydra vulgaris]|uniref:52 kDa repressor of the inhibitor of the protein kinase-like n=1 Tax=Hydra vulgaris TaxID=6087 RepID=A0ABM4BA64_HYDVU